MAEFVIITHHGDEHYSLSEGEAWNFGRCVGALADRFMRLL